MRYDCRSNSVDFRLSQVLCKLYESSNVQNEHDAVSVVLHLLMLETGYSVAEENKVKCR